jgi:phage terminase large subunit-like protein
MAKRPARSRSYKRASATNPDNPWGEFRHRADLYARRVCGDVEAGEPIVAGPLVRMACARHLADRVAAEAGSAFWFDVNAADVVIAFFETVLRLPDTQDDYGDPRPFLLAPAQDFIVGSVFGWKRSGTDIRRFRDIYCELGKGNGKTPMAAGVGLYLLVLDGENAAEVYAVAVTRDQAKVLFTDAERMRECSPELSSILAPSVNNISYETTHSFFRPLSSEHRGLDGKRPHGALIDEVHEHPNGMVVNKTRAGAKGRKQPIFWEITNSGYDRTSICWQHHEHSRRVLEKSVTDDQWFAFVAGLDEGDDPLTDPSCWIKANPLLGVSIQHEYLARQVESAKNIPAETNTVLRLNFCVWTQAVSRYFDMAKWMACGDAVPDAELIGQPCYAGLDLGQSDDFSAFVRLWLLEDGRVGLKVRFWLPRAALEKYPHRPYAAWERGGWLEITEGNTTDYDIVEAAVIQDCRESGVRELAYDKRFAEHMAIHFQAAGINCIDTPQGFFLNQALRRVNEWVVDGELCHGGNPILAFMADNSVVKFGRDQAIRLDKETAREKIDGIAALVMAADRVVRQPQHGASVYEREDIFAI